MRRFNWLIALLMGFLVVAIPSAYAAENTYTGSSDLVMFPATMDGGATITYQTDTVTFGVIDHAGSYNPPVDSVDVPGGVGVGDFQYTMDLGISNTPWTWGWRR
jgi:hypothetical protein